MVDRQCRNHRLQQFALTRARRASDQGVRPVMDQVEHDRSVRTDPDRKAQPVVGRSPPMLVDPFGGRLADPEQVEQRHHPRYRRGLRCGRGVANRSQRPGHLIGELGPCVLDVECPVGDLRVGRPQPTDHHHADPRGGRRHCGCVPRDVGGRRCHPHHADTGARRAMSSSRAASAGSGETGSSRSTSEPAASGGRRCGPRSRRHEGDLDQPVDQFIGVGPRQVTR